MDSLIINPIDRIDGEINLPGSKSLSNRALLMAAVAKGSTQIDNLLISDDTLHMLSALRQLGVPYSLDTGRNHCVVTGLSGPVQTIVPRELFLGNAGTAFRPLCAVLCTGTGEYILRGEPRMEERPIGPLVVSLRQAGADIDYLKNEGYPPLRICSRGLHGGRVRIDGSLSSQFLSALLLAAPLARNGMEIEVIGNLVSEPYISLTLHMLEQFGIAVQSRGQRLYIIDGEQSYRSPGRYLVEGDASSATYFLAAAASLQERSRFMYRHGPHTMWLRHRRLGTDAGTSAERTSEVSPQSGRVRISEFSEVEVTATIHQEKESWP